jgi:hypothetical protein
VVEKGLKWNPEKERGVRDSRRNFRKLAPEKTLQLFTLFKERDVVADEFLESLVSTPAMRAHLGPKYAKAIQELFHPSQKIDTVGLTSPAVIQKHPAVKLTLPQLKSKAEEFFWDLIRNIPSVKFWESQIRESLETKKFAKFLENDGECPFYEVAQAGIIKVNEKARTFELSCEGNEHRQTIESLKIRLKPDCDWQGVVAECWARIDNPTPRFLTQPALALFSWLRDAGFPSDWIKDRTLSWKAGFHGRGNVVEEYLWELRQKLGDQFSFESRGQRWGETREHRVSIDGEICLDTPLDHRTPPERLNPVVDVNFEHYGKKEFDRWRDFIHRHLLAIRPVATERVYLVWIDTQRELKRIFPKFNPAWYMPGSKLAGFWHKLPLHSAIQVEYSFEEHAPKWFVSLKPTTRWEHTLAELEEAARQPSIAEKYGLSPDAAKLLQWVEELKREEFVGSWTPVVEEEQEGKIGLSCPWGDENFPAYLQILVEEINEKTLHDLALQPWRGHSRLLSRLRVKKKETTEGRLVSLLQMYGLENGKTLTGSRLRNLLQKLLRE